MSAITDELYNSIHTELRKWYGTGTTAAIVKLDNLADQMAKLKAPSDKFNKYHSLLLQEANYLSKAAGLFNQAIKDNNQQMYNDGVIYVNKAYEVAFEHYDEGNKIQLGSSIFSSSNEEPAPEP